METPSFKEKLQAIYPKLTSSQKKVARYLFDNPNVLGVMSAQELAAQCGVSESTVIRFAQTLGYPGYLDMKQEIQRDLKNAYSSSQKLSATLRQFADQDTFFSELIQDHRQALDQLESTITLELLKQAAELIVSADTLYVFGEGSARAPVLELSFWLRRLGIDVVDISDTGRNFFEKIVHLTKNDAALAFGYRSKNQEVDILLKEIRERGGRTILVTDRALTNAVQSPDVVLRTARGKIGEFASMAIPVIIADALLVTVAKLEPERLEHLKSLEALRSRYGFS